MRLSSKGHSRTSIPKRLKNMKREFRYLVQALQTLKRVRLDRTVKRRIKSSYFKAIFLKRYDSVMRSVNILGFNVKFCSYDLFSYLFTEIFINNDYFFVTERASPFVVDCGSNIGMSILYFKMLYPESTILAFEPDDDAFACLEKNIQANHLNAVVANKMALSDRDGTVDFYYDPDRLGSLLMSTIQARMPKLKRLVPTSRLSTYIDRPVDFLKLDVEGAEFDIIKEVIEAGKVRYIKQMMIEYHHHIVKDSDECSKMLQLLEDAGFGYQIHSAIPRPLQREQPQDILIYAYQKNYSGSKPVLGDKLSSEQSG